MRSSEDSSATASSCFSMAMKRQQLPPRSRKPHATDALSHLLGGRTSLLAPAPHADRNTEIYTRSSKSLRRDVLPLHEVSDARICSLAASITILLREVALRARHGVLGCRHHDHSAIGRRDSAADHAAHQRNVSRCRRMKRRHTLFLGGCRSRKRANASVGHAWEREHIGPKRL
jgi:hypothetical protein